MGPPGCSRFSSQTVLFLSSSPSPTERPTPPAKQEKSGSKTFEVGSEHGGPGAPNLSGGHRARWCGRKPSAPGSCDAFSIGSARCERWRNRGPGPQRVGTLGSDGRGGTGWLPLSGSGPALTCPPGPAHLEGPFCPPLPVPRPVNGPTPTSKSGRYMKGPPSPGPFGLRPFAGRHRRGCATDRYRSGLSSPPPPGTCLATPGFRAGR